MVYKQQISISDSSALEAQDLAQELAGSGFTANPLWLTEDNFLPCSHMLQGKRSLLDKGTNPSSQGFTLRTQSLPKGPASSQHYVRCYDLNTSGRGDPQTTVGLHVRFYFKNVFLS